MQLRFNIHETIESEIYYGLYSIYVLGGHYIKAHPDFYIKIENIATGEEIELTEKFLKARNFKFGRKAVKFYEFQINDYGKFRISAQNYNDIIIKDSILEVYPFPFLIPIKILLFLTGRSNKQKNIDGIEILIS